MANQPNQPEVKPAPANPPPVQPAPKSTSTVRSSIDEAEAVVPHYGMTRPDSYELAIMQGKVTNPDGSVVSSDRAKPVIGHILDTAQQESAKGELKTGDIGWIELDEEGKPVGGALLRPPLDKPAAPVATVIETEPKIIATPSGANLTDKGMQPSPHTNKYRTSSYNRDYNAIAEARGEVPVGSAAR